MNQSDTPPGPRVSLGLPVYNGENYLALTLDTILAQTFTDFELIISDNASTDATRNICEDYAHRDDRIRYFRQDENLGAAANYDFVFHQSRGAYFKWCAHDDVFGEDFLATCVSFLEDHPDHVGALPKDVRIIDHEGNLSRRMRVDFGLDADNGARRFADFAPQSRRIHCAPFFALYRREVLARTNLHGDYQSGDRVLIAEMLLHGRVALIDTSSFSFRAHDQQYTRRMREGQDFCIQWLDPKKSGVRVMKHSRYVLEFARAVRRARLPLGERLIAYLGVARLLRAELPALARELLVPFYRNGRKTKLGNRLAWLPDHTSVKPKPAAKPRKGR